MIVILQAPANSIIKRGNKELGRLKPQAWFELDANVLYSLPRGVDIGICRERVS